MNRSELNKRVIRLGREEARLKKEIWKRIQKIISPYFLTCSQFSDEIVVCTKLSDGTIGHSWRNAVEYKIPYAEENNDWSKSYLAITKYGFYTDIYYAAACAHYDNFTVRQLLEMLKQIEKRKFNNIVTKW